MGVKGSKLFTPMELTNRVLQMLSSKESGSFGSFIKKDSFLKKEEEVISFLVKHFDIVLQYPVPLTDTRLNLTDRMKLRKGIMKQYIHKLIPITHEKSKKEFLEKVLNSPSITAFKVFLAKEDDKFNTFGREILRYREQLANPQQFPQSILAVAEMEAKLSDYPFKLYDKHFLANTNNLKVLYDIPVTYISCSLKLKLTKNIPEFLHQIDFIFLKECNGGSLNTVKSLDFFKLIKDTIPTIQALHAQNIYHMDIKVDNILKCDTSYKLIDFGLSYNIPPSENKTIRTEKRATKYLNEYVNNVKQQDDAIHKQIIDLQKLNPEKNSIIDAYIKSLVPNSALFYINPILLAFIYQIVFNTKEKITVIVKDLEESYQTTLKAKLINYKTDILDRFLLDYMNYITPDQYIDFTKIENNYHTFIRQLYNRHDWYCFAITLLLLYDKFTYVPDNFKKGIQYLVSLKDEDLEDPNLDKKLIDAFYSSRS